MSSVGKAVNGSVLASLRPGRIVRNSQIRLAAGTAGVGLGGAGVERARGRRDRSEQMAAATGGVEAGYGAYQGAGQLASHVNARTPRPEYMRQGLKRKDAQDKKAYDSFQDERRHWLKAARNPTTGVPNRAKQYRNYPRHWPGARVERTLGWTHAGNTGKAGAAAVALTGGAIAARRRNVEKAVSLRTLGGYARQGWKDPDIVVPALAGGGATGAGAVADRRRGRGSGRGAGGAAAGGVAGEAAWRATGLSLRNRGHQLERTLPEGMSRSRRTKLTDDHRKKFGIGHGDKAGIARTPAYARTYPKELPGWQYKRAVGQMSGRRGMALEAGVVTASALAGRRATRHHGQTSVGKKLVFEQDKVRPVRAAELAAGVGLASLGAPRMLGPALGRGVRAVKGQGIAPKALVEIEAARRSWLTGTSSIYGALPKLLQRPTVATATGVALAGHAVPVKRKTYRPVVMV